jgi:aryl sulfotransferase
MDKDDYPFWPFWENVRSWRQIRELPNLLLVHFNDLKRDMPAEMRRIAHFLDIPIDEARWPYILEYCSFDWMEKNATKTVPLEDILWNGGAQTFINKGTNGRWKDTITPEEIATYETRAIDELGAECAHWLAHGSIY